MPIKQLIEEEQAAARSRLSEMRKAEIARIAQTQAGRHVIDRASARDDAVLSRTEEAKMVRAARHTAIGLMSTTQRILKGANKLAERIEGELARSQVNPQRAVQVFGAIAAMARQTNETAKLAMQMERTLLGEPEKTVRHVMSATEAVREIEAAQRAADRARAAGLVIDVDGVAALPTGTDAE